MKSFIMNQEALMLDDELSQKIISRIKKTKRMTKSVVPSKITITSGKDGVDVFKQTINVW